MNNRYFFTALLMAALAFQTTGCSSMDTASDAANVPDVTAETSETKDEHTEKPVTSVTEEQLAVSPAVGLVNYTEKETTYEWDSTCTRIKADNSGFDISGEGASADGKVLSISMGGTYYLSGSIDEGRIIIDSPDTKAVRLVFGGFSIGCPDDAPINVKAADKLIITLENGTENSVSGNISGEEDAPSGIIFSKSDISFNGGGKLSVVSESGDGIVSKDKLKIISGSFDIKTADDGITGRDLVAVADGQIKIESQGDGIKSTNADDTEKGNIVIQGGALDITSENDGIQAENGLYIMGGDIKILSGSGNENGEVHRDDMMGHGFGGRFNEQAEQEASDTAEETESRKGIKSVNMLKISGGTVTADSADDSVHSGGDIDVSGGIMHLASGDDGIHSDKKVNISGGSIDINKCYEGIEGQYITVSDGSIRIVSEDDGFNVSSSERISDIFLEINGGEIYVDSAGDGLDSNGDIKVNGGLTIVNGPTNGANGPLDSGDMNNSIIVAGGTFIAAGSAQMFEAPSGEESTQNIVATTALNAPAGTLCTLADESGNVITAFSPSKNAAAIVISSPDIKTGTTCRLYTGGTYSGTLNENGYASGGTIADGTEAASFDISSVLSSYGNMMNGGHGGFRGGDPAQRPDGFGDFANGEPPQRPDDFGDFANGEPPQRPDGFGDFANGEPPQRPDDFGDFANGEPPQRPDGFGDFANGEPPQRPDGFGDFANGEPPRRPDESGNSANGEPLSFQK
ncbi:MAG: carbohydrate-binding domain-containing protein [Ruminococcus sp.]|nr:carbohydrate-binding domain-containing protein [Ruminococcus sp.]